MKNIQSSVLRFIDNDTNDEQNLQILNLIIDSTKIRDDKHELTSLLHLLASIGNNHRRSPNFFNKIEQIITILEEEIRKYYLNQEIFNIFKSNKRITLFLFEKQIIKMDKYVFNKICSEKQVKKSAKCSYFLPEIKEFLNNSSPYKNVTINEQYHELRRIGENNDTICQVIRNDSIDEFTKYIKENDYSLNSTIKSSIYETNPYLYSSTSLIQYAAFYGSINIFKYLMSNKVYLNPMIYLYAIHGNNIEIYQLIKNNGVSIDYNQVELYNEAIKCHHNDFVNYLVSVNSSYLSSTFAKSLKYHNFAFIQNKINDTNSFIYACKYDYYIFVNDLLNNTALKININYGAILI